MKNFTILSVIFLLVGCSQGSQPVVSSSDCFPTAEVQNGQLVPKYCPDQLSWRKYVDVNFDLSVSGKLFKFAADEDVVFDSSSNNDPPKFDDYYVKVFRSLPSTSCSPSLTGASETTKLMNAGGVAGWGRVDFYDSFGYVYKLAYDQEEPLCQPPEMQFDTEGEHENGKRLGNSQAYALCAEKDSKTVVVCISQMKDDREMVKQIFETFRWTK